MSINKHNQYYPKIEQNKQIFLDLLDKIEQEKNITEKIELATIALNFAVEHNTGYFTSSALENIFTKYAQSIDIEDYNIQYKPNSFLHVLTQGYLTGGHTRVVERWIENAPQNQNHSVVFINSKQIKPLEDIVKTKNGETIYLDKNLSLTQKALKLRELALHYQYIILHTHKQDPIATIAFGTSKFTRPVALYNHSSHMFWIGKNIADIVLDIEDNDEVTKIKRNISNTFFLGVPSQKINFQQTNKNELRKKLGLPLNKKIIVSSGAGFKYNPIGNDDFTKILNCIIDENTFCYIIGVNPQSKYWKNAYKNSKGHIIPMKSIHFSKGYLDYLGAADLYLDSFPCPGGTASIDAIANGTPVLSLKAAYPQFDYLTTTPAYCQNEQEFIEKSKKILENKQYSDDILQILQKQLEKYQSVEAWNNKINNLISVFPKEHNVKDLSNEKDYDTIDDLAVLNNVLTDKDFFTNKKNQFSTKNGLKSLFKYGLLTKKQGIPYIFTIYTYTKNCKKRKIVKLFGITIINYIK